MKKHTFDQRSWLEIVNNLVSERTSIGDSISLKIKYNDVRKPQLWLNFSTYDPDKKKYASEEEITDWLPDSPFFERDDQRYGFDSWRDLIELPDGVALQIKAIVMAGGRNFSYTEI